MFTWGALWQEVGNILPHVLVAIFSIIIGFLFGKYPERKYWKDYMSRYRDRISQENFSKLERKLAVSEASLEVAKGVEKKLFISVRAARLLNQKVQELLSL
jgi:hypothetical protein